jgi:hypothetical protein
MRKHLLCSGLFLALASAADAQVYGGHLEVTIGGSDFHYDANPIPEFSNGPGGESIDRPLAGALLLVTGGVYANGSVLGQAFGSTDAWTTFNSYSGPALQYQADSSWSASVRVVGYGTDVTSSADGYCTDNAVGQQCGGAGFGTYGVEFFALNMQLVTITLEADAHVGVSAGAYNMGLSVAPTANADGVADLGQTTGSAGWSGIPSVTYQGNPVASFTAIGQYSGIDYSEPLLVPAPSPQALQSAALIALALLRGAQRRAWRRPTGSGIHSKPRR